MLSSLGVFGFLILLASVLAQDFGTNYNAGDHGRTETVSPDGEVQGQYQYTDPEGKLITVKYRAGKDGFQVEGDHLPRAPQPGPPQQAQQPFYNPQQQYQSAPYQPQPAPFFNQQPQQPQFNPFFSQQQQFQNFGQNQFQGHPNALQDQFQPQPHFLSGQQQSGQPQPAKVTVSQQPGAGFTYSLEA